jgi:AraC-like DNA-binding protein
MEDLSLIIKKVVVAHRYHYEENQSHHYHDGRNAYGFVHLLSGALEYTFNDGRVLTVKAGDLTLLKPTDAYVVKCLALCHHYTVNFLIDESSVQGEFLHTLLHSQKTPQISRQSPQNSFADILENLCDVWAQKQTGYPIYSISLLYKLFYRFLQTQIPYLHDKNYDKIKCATEYIDAHWNESFTLSDLAKLCYMSPVHLRHLFEQVYKISPMEYRNSLRLLHAKDYLGQEHFSITEIAEKCGFSDVNYFSRFFKKNTGISPSKYRLF